MKTHSLSLMRRSSLPPSALILAAFSIIHLMSFYAKAQDHSWNYRGKIVESSESTIYLAEVQLSDDSLHIYYSVPDRTWYIEFRYVGDVSIDWDVGGGHPEFFQRTNEALNMESGRYDTDYIIKNAFRGATKGAADVITMALTPKDVEALQKFHALGVTYWVNEGGYRHYRFPPDGLSKAVQHIKLDIADIPQNNAPASFDRLVDKEVAPKYQQIVRNFQFSESQCTEPELIFNAELAKQQGLSDKIRHYIECINAEQNSDEDALRTLVMGSLDGSWSKPSEGQLSLSIPYQYGCNAEFSALLKVAKERADRRTAGKKRCIEFKEKHMLYDIMNYQIH